MALLVFVALYAACSTTEREDKVVAAVEGKEITVADFEKTAELIDESYLPDTNNLEGKKKVLDYIIAKEVMVLRAKDLGLEKDEAFRSFWNHYRDPFLIQAITKHYIMDKVKVNEKEVKDYNEKMKNEYVLSQITVLDSMKAVQLRREILDGADFAEMARKHSIGYTAKDGGRLGTMSIGSMYWWVEEALFQAEKGDVTPPVRVNNGFSILKVHDKRKIIPDQDIDYARKRARSIKEKKMLQKVKREIAKDMNFQIFPDVLTIAYNSLPEDVPMGDIFNRKITYANAPKLDVRDEYMGMILCQYEGNDYTLEDFEYIYDNLGLPERPRREQGPEGIVDLLYKKFFNDVLPEYAEKRLKLLEDPEVKAEMDWRREQFLLQLLFNKAIKQEVNVSDKEVELYYQEHKDEIKTREKREFAVIINSDREIVEEVKKLAEEGQDFSRLAASYSEDPLVEQDNGEKGLNVRGTYPEFDEVAFSLEKEGDISPVFKTGRGWAVLKLKTILESRALTEKESRRSVRQMLNEKKTNEMFDKKVAEWRKKYNIQVFEENLAEAKLERLRED